jgi:hypothetical protein
VNVTSLDAAFTGFSHPGTKLSSGISVYYYQRTKPVENSTMKKMDENAVAEMIVSVLPTGVVRELSSDRDSIRYAVRGEGFKLRTIVFNRKSLRKLLDDAAAAVKIEYLQRDLLDTLATRSEFRYPRPHLTPAHATRHRWPIVMPFASVV